MDLDKRYVVVVVRQDMFPDHQMVHAFHLGLLAGKALDGFCQKRHTLSGHPNVLLYGVPSESSFEKIREEFKKLEIEFIAWVDPDSQEGHDDYGLAGIVTEPITKTQRNKLSRLRQWSANNNTHPFGKGSVVAETAS